MAERAIVMPRPRLVKIGEMITIDACKEEQHEFVNTVTKHPVEEGPSFTDHVRPEQDTVTLQCFISNTPLSRDQRTRAVREGSITFETTADADVPIGAVDGRGALAFEKLYKLRMEGTLIAVVTTLKTYGLTKNGGMVISKLSVPRNSKNYDGLEFSISLQEITVVRNKLTKDVRPSDGRGRKKNTGAQAPKPPEEEASVLHGWATDGSKSDNKKIANGSKWILSGGK